MAREPDTYTEIVWDIMKEIEYNDPNFEFLASMLSYGLANNGYTEKQLKYIKKYKDRYSYIWEDCELPQQKLMVIQGGKNAVN